MIHAYNNNNNIYFFLFFNYNSIFTLFFVSKLHIYEICLYIFSLNSIYFIYFF
ncbi:hypothetical protein H8356DRAFT_1671691, partial [Neocallimastix lanati (nom. inval.)]